MDALLKYLLFSTILFTFTFARQPFVHRWHNNYKPPRNDLHIIENNDNFLEQLEQLWNSPIQRHNLLADYQFSNLDSLTKKDLSRKDESNDSIFYAHPRLVHHVDTAARGALQLYYQEQIALTTNMTALLDICSSWTSHLSTDVQHATIVGVGMNEMELKSNPMLDKYIIQDLNFNSKLPFGDNTFNCVLNSLSIDYLTKPKEIFQEVHRVLKPGGSFIVAFSNRCFPTKAISIWLRTNDMQHVALVGNYFASFSNFVDIQAYDISPPGRKSDPLYIVQAYKKRS